MTLTNGLLFQDYYHNNCTASDSTVKQLDDTCALMRDCCNILLKPDDLSVNIVLLEAVAMARYSLTVCAQWLYRLYIEKNVDRDLSYCARKLCDASSCLCDQKILKWPR